MESNRHRIRESDRQTQTNSDRNSDKESHSQTHTVTHSQTYTHTHTQTDTFTQPEKTNTHTPSLPNNRPPDESSFRGPGGVLGMVQSGVLVFSRNDQGVVPTMLPNIKDPRLIIYLSFYYFFTNLSLQASLQLILFLLNFFSCFSYQEKIKNFRYFLRSRQDKTSWVFLQKNVFNCLTLHHQLTDWLHIL